MGDVIMLGTTTKLDLPPARVLESAIEAAPEPVLIIGEADDGLYLAASTGDLGELLILLERAKREIMARIE